MQVQNNSITAALFNAQASQATRPNVADNEKAASQTSAVVSSVTGRSTSNAITGTTGSRLSTETTAELIKSSQQASTSAPASPLPKAVQHHLDEIANNPGYGAEQVSLMGKHPMAIVMSGDMPTNKSSPAETAAFLRKSERLMAANTDAFAPRKELYETMKVEGLPPAQIFANLLAFNATQKNYNALADTGQGNPEGYTTNMIKAEYTYLQNAITQANSAESIE